MPHTPQHVDVTFKLHRYTASEWVRRNPILAEGEPGYEKNTNRIKVGDGVTRWTLLPYVVSETRIRQLINEAIVQAGGVALPIPEDPESTIPEDEDISFVLLYENAKA